VDTRFFLSLVILLDGGSGGGGAAGESGHFLLDGGQLHGYLASQFIAGSLLSEKESSFKLKQKEEGLGYKTDTHCLSFQV
jgi:hypothetical protein